MAATEAAKVILYIRSILDDIGIPQLKATTLYDDIEGARMMKNCGQSTKLTGHMDTKAFALQHWVETNLLILKRIGKNDNKSDSMVKNVGRTLLYRYMDYLMGKLILDYAKKYKDLRLYDQAFSTPVRIHKKLGDSIMQTLRT